MDPATEASTGEAIRIQLERILASRAFARSERQRRFLRFVVEKTLEGSPDAIKEAQLGIEVFDRGAAFDPRADNIVRVEARRLRQRLEDYHSGEGLGDPVLIELPKGSYVPQFSLRDVVASAPASPADLNRAPRGRYVWVAAGAAALALLAGAVLLARHFASAPVSVAVLPFAGFPAADDHYQADGITEDITQALAQSRQLRVVARTSAFQFRGTSLDVREIGRRLGAGLVVEGSVQRRDGRIVIAARLVDVRNGFQVWAASEETDGSGIESAERTLVTGLSRALNSDPPRRGSNHTAPAEAQDLVLRGRYLASRGGDDNQAKAIEAYTRAAALDPDYARAWGEMARALSLQAFHDYAAAPRLAPRIKAAAERAIALDPRLPDAHVALARLAWSWDLDWNAAERHWLRALEVNPNYAAAQVSYALALASRRRGREAVAAARSAIELDPLSFAAANDLGVVLYLARRFDESAAHARKSLALAPDSKPPHFLLGVAFAASGRYAEGIVELERVAAVTGRPAAVLARLCNAYARAGRHADAAATRAEIERNPESGHVHAAMAATALGDHEAALRHLEQSAVLRETDFLFIGADPIFDPIRGAPRFAALCGKLRLSPQ